MNLLVAKCLEQCLGVSAIVEVLQFLTQSGKTGILRVYDETDTKLLAFEHGQLLYAIHQRKLPLLAELLIHREVLSEENSAKLPVSDMRWDDVVTRALCHR